MFKSPAFSRMPGFFLRAQNFRHRLVTQSSPNRNIPQPLYPALMKSNLRKLLLASLLTTCSVSAFAQMTINGAGATFPYPIYSKWFDEYAKVDPSVRFNYQSIGSGGGQKQILAETVDFGASDGPMSDENLAKAPRK